MKVVFHRGVQQDVSEVLKYYDQVGGEELGDAFFAALVVFYELNHRLRHSRSSA